MHTIQSPGVNELFVESSRTVVMTHELPLQVNVAQLVDPR
jgi:hypothetical protein